VAAAKSSKAKVMVPVEVAREITDVARRTRRSVAFVVRRALGSGPPPGEASGELVALELTVDDDDPANLVSKIRAAAGDRELGGAIAAAWGVMRARFLEWAAREESAAEAERADDLDAALAEAAAPDTPPERLAALSSSEYVRVRALVAAHPRTPPDVRARLAADKDRVVRAAAAPR
jgi:hypothetical protein